MANYLVTGGAGFIGSNLVRALLDDHQTVRVLDNFATGKRENLTEISDRVELIEGDIRDPDACRSACADIDVVFHEAALGSVPRSVEDPVTTNEVNIGGTVNVLWAAKEAKVQRLVYAASSSAYGESDKLPKQEDMIPAPISPYAVSKLAGEHYCHTFYKSYGLETISLRYFNVFGPRQDPKGQYAAVIPKFVSCLLKGQPPTVYGDGEQSRGFTYISNVVAANMLAAKAPDAQGQVVNVACHDRVSLNQILEILRELLNTDIQANYTDDRPGDVKHSLAEITRAKELIGYEPQVSFEQGLRMVIDWYKANL